MMKSPYPLVNAWSLTNIDTLTLNTYLGKEDTKTATEDGKHRSV